MKNISPHSLNKIGYQIVEDLISPSVLNSLQKQALDFKEASTEIRKNVFEKSNEVKNHFKSIEKALTDAGLSCQMTAYCFYLEKTEGKNWPLQFHQDLNLPAYLNLNKDETENWLERGFWVRINLDANDKNTGAIKVIPKSHLNGKNSPFNKKEAIFLNVNQGDTVLFKPLLYHGSDKMTTTWERRIFQCFFLEN